MKFRAFFLLTLAMAGTISAGAQVTGILGAFSDETELILSQVRQKEEVVIQKVHFTKGLLRGRLVVVALSGIGKVNAAITTTLMLEHFQLSEIIFTGIAGALDPALSPGDLVIGTELGYHDYGFLLPDSLQRRPTHNLTTMQENPLFFPCDSRLVELAASASLHTALEKVGGPRDSLTPRIVKGRIVTGDEFISSQAANAVLRKQMDAEATEMEGAAVAQTCWQQHVPFVVIRCMSDKAGNNAYIDLQNFYRIAARNSANLVMEMVQMLGR